MQLLVSYNCFFQHNSVFIRSNQNGIFFFIVPCCLYIQLCINLNLGVVTFSCCLNLLIIFTFFFIEIEHVHIPGVQTRSLGYQIH